MGAVAPDTVNPSFAAYPYENCVASAPTYGMLANRRDPDGTTRPPPLAPAALPMLTGACAAPTLRTSRTKTAWPSAV